MKSKESILTDNFGRYHNYLRISLTERCNLRCSYCMPLEGFQLSPSENLMSAEEIYEIAKIFVKFGVNKIRLTGGEPLVRKDFIKILNLLSTLNIELSLTTNAVSVDRYFNELKKAGVKTVNVSLDTLSSQRFHDITFRNYFDRVYENIFKLIDNGFKTKINAVIMRGTNDDEIISFVNFTKNNPVTFRVIEFMPFDGNQWRREKTVSYKEIMNKLQSTYQKDQIIRIKDAPNDTSKNYKIKGYKGAFAIISTVTNPFCDQCNRIRLTANGKLKNCLFSQEETNLLKAFRNKEDLEQIIFRNISKKYAVRSGLSDPENFEDPREHKKNRSMIAIGG